MKNKVETLKVGERVFVTPIGDVEVMVTKLANLHLKNAPFKGMEELQKKTMHTKKAKVSCKKAAGTRQGT